MTDAFFTTNARADPAAAFVGRERELREMIARVERGALTLAISGERGLGKTALAYAFAATTERMFPGGTIRTQGLPFTPRDDSLFQQIQDRLRLSRTLIVIDDADLFEERYFAALLFRIREMRDVVTVAVLTQPRRHEAFDLTIHLEQLPFEEIEAMLLARFPRSAARRTLQILREQVDVSPRLALELANYLAVHGEGADPNELLSRWHSFRQSGLLGPDGTPLKRDAEQAKEIVIDVVSVNTELLSILNRYPDLLRKVSTRQFEEIVAELLHRLVTTWS